MKARLVADRRDQDPELYPNKFSPTVAIHSVFTVLGLAMVKMAPMSGMNVIKFL